MGQLDGADETGNIGCWLAVSSCANQCIRFAASPLLRNQIITPRGKSLEQATAGRYAKLEHCSGTRRSVAAECRLRLL